MVPASVRTKLMRMTGFRLHKRSTIWAGANLRSRKITCGAEVFINVGFYHDGYDFLTIGERVRIGPYVRMITATHEIGSAEQRGQVEVVGKPITVEDACWIGTGVTLMPGVTVAAGCVLAAGAVLYESTQPNGLYAGSPALRVRDLDF
jgi:maltose O-acetyltransferase